MIRLTSKPVPHSHAQDLLAAFGVSILAFLFFWLHVHPSLVVRGCSSRAEREATSILSAKASLAADPQKSREFVRMLQSRLYFKEDYEFSFKRCMRQNGIY